VLSASSDAIHLSFIEKELDGVPRVLPEDPVPLLLPPPPLPVILTGSGIAPSENLDAAPLAVAAAATAGAGAVLDNALGAPHSSAEVAAMTRLLARLSQLHAAHERGGGSSAGDGGGSSCGDSGSGSGSGVLLAGGCGSSSEGAVAASSALLRVPTPHRPPVSGIRMHCLCSKDALTHAMSELEVGLRAAFDLRDRRRHPLPCFDFRGAVLLIRRVWLAWSVTGTVEVIDQSFSHHVQGCDARITLCAGAGAGDEAAVLRTAPQAFSKSAASERHFGEDAGVLARDAGSDYNLTRSPSEGLGLSGDAVAVADDADACAVAVAVAVACATTTATRTPAQAPCQQGAWPGGDVSGLESGLGPGPGPGSGTSTGSGTDSPPAIGVRAQVRSLTQVPVSASATHRGPQAAPQESEPPCLSSSSGHWQPLPVAAAATAALPEPEPEPRRPAPLALQVPPAPAVLLLPVPLALSHRQCQWAPPAAGALAALATLAAAGPGAMAIAAARASASASGCNADQRATGSGHDPSDSETDHDEWEAC